MIEDVQVQGLQGMASHDLQLTYSLPTGLRKLMNSMVFRKPQSQHRVDRVKLEAPTFSEKNAAEFC